MTPLELFGSELDAPQYIHGSDVGVDEGGGLWVRADAELKASLGGWVLPLNARVKSLNSREYSILTPGKKTCLNARYRQEPVWDHIQELKADAIGSEWIAVG